MENENTAHECRFILTNGVYDFCDCGMKRLTNYGELLKITKALLDGLDEHWQTTLEGRRLVERARTALAKVDERYFQ